MVGAPISQMIRTPLLKSNGNDKGGLSFFDTQEREFILVQLFGLHLAKSFQYQKALTQPTWSQVDGVPAARQSVGRRHKPCSCSPHPFTNRQHRRLFPGGKEGVNRFSWCH